MTCRRDPYCIHAFHPQSCCAIMLWVTVKMATVTLSLQGHSFLLSTHRIHQLFIHKQEEMCYTAQRQSSGCFKGLCRLTCRQDLCLKAAPRPHNYMRKMSQNPKTHQQPNHNVPSCQRSTRQRLRGNSGSKKATLLALSTLDCALEAPGSFQRDAALWASCQKGRLYRSGVQPGLHGFQNHSPAEV